MVIIWLGYYLNMFPLTHAHTSRFPCHCTVVVKTKSYFITSLSKQAHSILWEMSCPSARVVKVSLVPVTYTIVKPGYDLEKIVLLFRSKRRANLSFKAIFRLQNTMFPSLQIPLKSLTPMKCVHIKEQRCICHSFAMVLSAWACGVVSSE